MVKARTNMIRTHKALRTVQHDMGLGEVAFMGPCPESAVAPSHVTLASVAA
jgi:hypothetical protein